MRVSYEVRGEDESVILHGIVSLEKINYIVFNAMDNGHTIEIEPFYEENEDE